jgi:hypothetical protein
MSTPTRHIPRDPRILAAAGVLLAAVAILVVARGWIGLLVPLAVLALGATGAISVLLLREPQVEEWSFSLAGARERGGNDARVGLLQHLLATKDAETGRAQQLKDVIAALADDRLAASHGVHRASHADQASALLGPELTAYLETSPARTLTVTQASAIIRRLEEL